MCVGVDCWVLEVGSALCDEVVWGCVCEFVPVGEFLFEFLLAFESFCLPVVFSYLVYQGHWGF